MAKVELRDPRQNRSSRNPAKSRRRVWIWIGRSVLIAGIALLIIGHIVIRNAAPILKGRVIETLSTRFESPVELENLSVAVLPAIEVSGDRLRIFPSESLAAAGATQPVIALDHFSFHSGLIGLFIKPMHVGAVYVTGMHINIPPSEIRQRAAETNKKKRGKIKIDVDEIICDDSKLIIETTKPDKDPKDFELKHVELHDVGPNAPWKYDATLTNAIPRGEIHSVGTFGPWQKASPGDSPVTGHYTFEHADLNTIKGIGGILSSVGNFKGQLNKILVDGSTETPDFSLDTSNHPVPLHTTFHAIVDGTTGDTYLQPVNAKLLGSAFTTSGTVINIKGHGHRIELDVDISDARLQDFLALAVKTNPPVMTGIFATKTRLQIPPGKESVSQKLNMQSDFTLRQIHFTNPKVQDKVDMLSFRARGKPGAAKAGAQDVNSRITGRFVMANGVLQFGNVSYTLPGAQVNLQGAYSLDGQRFDFYGKVLTDASLPNLVDSRWQSLLLRAVSPFLFKRKGGGAAIPLSITGTRSEPKFGLDVFSHHH